MANRKRVIYQSEALYVGTTGADPVQLARVQSANYSFEITRTDINEFGKLAAIDRIILEQPTVSLDFSYYPETGLNENLIGLSVDSASAIKDILANADTHTPKNYYILTVDEGEDASDTAITNTDGMIGIGNCFLTSFNAEASVGEFVTSAVNAEGLNMHFDISTDGSCQNPTVDPETGDLKATTDIQLPEGETTVTDLPVALRPGDIAFSDDGAWNAAMAGNVDNYEDLIVGYKFEELKVQSFTVSMELGREDLQKLGSRFAFSKEIEFPATASMDISANVGDDKAADDSLEYILNTTDAEKDLGVACNSAAGVLRDAGVDGLQYLLKGAKLDSESISSSIGDMKSVDFSFSSQIGGPNDDLHGIRVDRIENAAA